MNGAEPYRSMPFHPSCQTTRLDLTEPKGKDGTAASGCGHGEGGRTRGAAKKRSRGTLRYAVALAFLLTAFMPAATALCGTAIAVTPTRIPMRLTPGETGSESVELINQGDAAAELRPEVLAVTVDETGTTAFSRDESCSWLCPDKAELVLAPGARESCSFTVNVPEDAAPGAYRLALSFAPARESESGVGFTGGIAVLIELEVLSARQRTGGNGGSLATGLIVSAVAAAAIGAIITAILVARSRRKKAPGKAAGGGET